MSYVHHGRVSHFQYEPNFGKTVEQASAGTAPSPESPRHLEQLNQKHDWAATKGEPGASSKSEIVRFPAGSFFYILAIRLA